MFRSILLALALVSTLAVAGPPAIQGKEGDLTLLTLDGKEVKLKKYGRKVTVLAYWGVFCGPCIEELPLVEKLFQKYKKDKDVAVLSISVDPVKTPEDRAAIQAFVQKLKLTLPVLVDRGALAKRLTEGPGAGDGAPKELALPMLVVIDPAFNVYRELGWKGPQGFLEEKSALIEAARAGKLPPSPQVASPAGGATSPLKLSLKKMSPQDFNASIPNFMKNLAKTFPTATEADLAGMVEKMRKLSETGGTIQLLPPGMSPEIAAALSKGREADRLAPKDPKGALALYQQAWDGGMRDPGMLYNAACAASLSAELEQSFSWLGRAADAGFVDAKWAQKDSDLDPLKADPRFGQLLARFEANGDKSLAAENAKQPALQKELLAMVEEDQEARRAQIADGAGAGERLKAVDQKTTARMKEIIQQHGWPGKTLVGVRAAHGAWLLVQHADADPAFQRQLLPLLEEAVKKGEATGADLAYLTDRVLTADKKPQRYGTQFHTVDGKLVPRPIEDPANVDARRAAIGLGTMAEYTEQMMKTYGEAMKRQAEEKAK